jgi:hypothetical protein
VNQATSSRIREACRWAKTNGHTLLRGGPWFDFTTAPWGCDALGAVLLQEKLVTMAAGPGGLTALAKATLDVDSFWLRRFWLGWDRGYQVMITAVRSDCFSGSAYESKESKDDVSAFGIALWKEMSRS